MTISPRVTLFTTFALAYFLSYFFRSANAVIAGDLTHDLGLTAAQLGLMTSLFYASFALIQLPLGAALDRYGSRWVTPSLMLATVCGCLLFASAQSFTTLALGRALIGLGMAGVLMGAFKAFGQWYPQQHVATISGFMVGIGASGGLAAATPLAWLNELVGWRAIFLGAAPITLLSALAIVVWTRNTPSGAARQAAAQHPGGLGQIMRDMRFWRIAPLNFFLLGTAQAVQGLWGGPYLIDVLGFSSLAAGNLLLAMGGGVVAGYFACGWLADRLGSQRVVVVGMLVLLVCQLSFVLSGQLPLALRYSIFVAFGFAGAFNIVLLAQIRALFPPYMSGRAVTAVNLFGFAGTALIQWWMGVIVGAWPRNALGQYPPMAYTTAFAAVALATALALAWYVPLALARPSYIAEPPRSPL